MLGARVGSGAGEHFPGAIERLGIDRRERSLR